MDVRATSEFQSWIDSLRDRVGRARILVRIDRLAHGHAGHYRVLNSEVAELKIDVGPGYRVYFTRRGSCLVLLAGGDKSSQRRDVVRATRLARGLQE